MHLRIRVSVFFCVFYCAVFFYQYAKQNDFIRSFSFFIFFLLVFVILFHYFLFCFFVFVFVLFCFVLFCFVLFCFVLFLRFTFCSFFLFFLLFGIDTEPTAVELFPRRSNNHDDEVYLMEHVRFEDPYDSLLYAEAKKIFQEEIDFVKKWKNVTI
jgi:energy-coupling factor transporter transmembrane protein EcfT